MFRHILIVSLMVLYMAPCYAAKAKVSAQAKNIENITIQHEFIKIIDGTPFINIPKMLALEKGLYDLRNGKREEFLFMYQGKKYSLLELVDIEKKCKPGREGKACRDKFSTILADAIKHYEDITHSYLQDARGRKTIMCAIIEDWRSQAGIETILSEWSNQAEGQEMLGLKKLATSLFRLNQLVRDLQLFMGSLRRSCHKSWNAHVKSTRQNA